MSPEIHDPWFALYVKPRHEKLVAKTLVNKGYETFLPLYRARHRSGRRFQDVDLPLFPNYVFCRIDLLKRLPVLTVPGVCCIVSIGKQPATVDDWEIESVKQIADSGLPSLPWPFLRTGDRIQIGEGPLKGIQGILLATDKDCQLVVSVSLLQRSVSVIIERRWVRPLDYRLPIAQIELPCSCAQA